MAKKIDLSRVKDFLFNHGEKVALGVCGFIAIVLGGLKLMDAAGAGIADGTNKTWAEAFKDAKNGIATQMASAPLANIDTSAMKPEFYVWETFESKYVASRYSEVPEFNDSKRRNPVALKVLDDPKNIRLDYVRGLVFVHDYDPAERTVKGVVPAGTGAAAPPAGGPKQKGDPAGLGAIPDRLKAGRSQRFVVVQAVFPMKQQVEEFRKALKMATQKELFDLPREDLPKILGINVVRFELTKIGGEPVPGKEAEIVVQFEKGRLHMQPALEKLLREAMYDDYTPTVLEPYLYEGLAMPLPKLAYGRYPRFQFPGWELAWGDDEPERKVIAGNQPPPQKGPGIVIPGKGKPKPAVPVPMPQPGQMPVSAVELDLKTIRDRELREFDPILSSRLFGNFDNKEKKLENDLNVFQVLGQFAPAADEVKPAAGQPPIGGRPGLKYFSAWDVDPPEAAKVGPMPAPKGGKLPKDAPPPPVFPAWERDALVRFIDADVHPGKTYSYAIQVRVANPNFKKDDKVAAAFLATVPELQDNFSWVTTPSITIPQDYFLYALDQHLFDEMANPLAGKKFDAKLSKDATTFQIHQWVTEKVDLVKNDKYVIGDWAIVERQVVRKGERIGAIETVPVPVWRDIKEAFEVPRTPANFQKNQPEKIGARIVLKSEADAPVLVDFAGGRRMKPNNAGIDEETALEALILTPDGKLRVHNSRDDAVALQPEAQVQDQPFQAISRQERWLTSQNRVREVRQATTPATMKIPGK